jgi:preprotein translocase subunit YajC
LSINVLLCVSKLQPVAKVVIAFFGMFFHIERMIQQQQQQQQHSLLSQASWGRLETTTTTNDELAKL